MGREWKKNASIVDFEIIIWHVVWIKIEAGLTFWNNYNLAIALSMKRSEISILDTMGCNNPKYRMDIGYLIDVPVSFSLEGTTKWKSGRAHKGENYCLFGSLEIDSQESERNSLSRGVEKRVEGGKESDWWKK